MSVFGLCRFDAGVSPTDSTSIAPAELESPPAVELEGPPAEVEAAASGAAGAMTTRALPVQQAQTDSPTTYAWRRRRRSRRRRRTFMVGAFF